MTQPKHYAAGVISAKGTAGRIWLVLNYLRGLLWLRMVKDYSVLAATIKPSKSTSHCASSRPGWQDMSDTPLAAPPVPQQNEGQVTRAGGREQGETCPQMCDGVFSLWKLFSSTCCEQGKLFLVPWSTG